MNVEKFSYDNQIVKMFTFATVFWGVVGMLVGLLIALQLYIPSTLVFSTQHSAGCDHFIQMLLFLHLWATQYLPVFTIPCSVFVKPECLATCLAKFIFGDGS